MPGTLILCATPIGNLDDVSTRLNDALASADVILAEDTRRTSKLLHALGVTTPMRSYFAGNEQARNAELVRHLSDGATVALVSDAGMPVVSDPGASAVGAAVTVGAVVTAVPGPSAPVTALAISGFDGDRFVFEGFLPRKGAVRATRLASIAADSRTTVIFCATRRVGVDLAELADLVDDERQIVVTRELTKLHEEVWRGTVREAAAEFSDDTKNRGEFTVVGHGGGCGGGTWRDRGWCVCVASGQSRGRVDGCQQERSVRAAAGVTRRVIGDSRESGGVVATKICAARAAHAATAIVPEVLCALAERTGRFELS
jgi:16S rRNA (cytidine1402-2'-O)-methyltransferase